jgi:hypothetical protein
MIHAKHDHRSGEKDIGNSYVNGRVGNIHAAPVSLFSLRGRCVARKKVEGLATRPPTKVRGNKKVLKVEDFMKHTAYQHAIESAYLIEFILAPLGIVDDGLVAVME